MACLAGSSFIQSYSAHLHTHVHTLNLTCFFILRASISAAHALHHISFWQVGKSKTELSHGGCAAFLLEKYYLYFRSKWFTTYYIKNLRHKSLSPNFHITTTSLCTCYSRWMTEWTRLGSQTWLSLGDQCAFCIQDTEVCVTNNSKTRDRSFIKAAPPRSQCMLNLPCSCSYSYHENQSILSPLIHEKIQLLGLIFLPRLLGV